jgi:endonuclease G
MNYIKFIIILIFISEFSYSQYYEIHSKHFFFGYPKGSPTTNDLIIRDIYALSNNDSTKFADWVVYRLDSITISGPSQKERKWLPDIWLADEETLEPKDYDDAPKLLAIDRGHQAPLANFKGTNVAEETNYLSNITPQKSDLNRGVWKQLEDFERKLTLNYGLVYVMTGPLYEKKMPPLPNADEPHRIPSGYWKILAIANNQKINDIRNFAIFGFIFEQSTPTKSDLKTHLVSIKEIETRSKLNFHWEIPSIQQATIEAKPNSLFDKYFAR